MARRQRQDALFRDLFTRIEERVGGASAITQVAEWLTRHTRLAGRPFSFKDHEFQIAICNSTAPHCVIQKPTQVGLSELSFRIALALCAIRQHFSLIYVFPSAIFAGEVSKMRISPIIEDSEKLSQLLIPGADSTMSKRIGSSNFYMGGAATKSQAISRPVQGLIIDEKDFANQSVLTSYQGRLRHVKEKDQIVREFSTPTVAEYGINADLERSQWKRFMVRCSHCGERQAPDFKTQVTIPGFDRGDFTAFTKDDLMNPHVLVEEAYIRCVRCGKSLDFDLAMTAEREWVAMQPDKSLDGFAVKPFDLPLYNPTARLVKDFGKYADVADYWNFVQGEVFASDTNQVNLDVLRNRFLMTTISDGHGHQGMAIGIDVGNTFCYAMAGFRTMINGIAVTMAVWRKRYSVHDGPFLEQIIEDLRWLRPDSGVIDTMPDGTLSRGFHDYDPQRLFAASYRKDVRASLDYQDLNRDKGVVQIQRTKAFNVLVKELNTKRWVFSTGPDQEVVCSHFVGMKRVQQQTEDKELVQQWVKVGDKEDHYLHAAMYLKSALDLLETPSSEDVIPVMPGFSGVKIQGGQAGPAKDDELSLMARVLGLIPGRG